MIGDGYLAFANAVLGDELVGAVDHPLEHAAYALPLRIKIVVRRLVYVSTFARLIKPGLCFCSFPESLVYGIFERRSVWPARPCFGDKAAYGTG